MKNKILNFISLLILTCILSLSISNSLISTLHFGYTIINQIMIITAFVLCYSLISYNKITKIIFSSLFFSLLIFSFFYFRIYKSIVSYFEKINEYLFWIFDYTNGDVDIEPFFARLTMFLLIFIITLTIYFFTIKKFNFVVILLCGISVFVAQWMLDYFISYISFYIFAVCILIYYLISNLKSKQKNSSSQFVPMYGFILWSIPFCFIVFLLSYFLPIKATPITWEWMDSKINSIITYFQENIGFSNYEYFSLTSTGFNQNSNKLGGKVKLDNTTVLEVNSPRRVYLRGSSSDTYTSTSWINSDNNLTKFKLPNRFYNNPKDEFETSYFLLSEDFSYSNNSDKLFEKYFYKDEINVTYKNLITKSVFLPIKPITLEFTDTSDQNLFFNKDMIFSTEKTNKNGFNYKSTIYTLKPESQELRNLLIKSKKGIYDQALNEISSFRRFNTTRSRALRSINMNDLNLLKQNSDEIYQKYTAIPQSIPTRVKDLAIDITKSIYADYDKVKAIETYLSTNYPYTLTPKITPRNKDFVDSFLFDVKEGYCTYYASAMVVMLRSLGIPSRYIEGYVLPSTLKSENTYEVTNNQAHAWAEVYFEGFGWVMFEPTSAYTSSYYNSDSSTGIYSQEFLEDPEYQDYLNNLPESEQLELLDPVNISETSNLDINVKYIILYSSCALILLFIIFIIINNIKRLIWSKLVKSKSNKDCILELFNLYVKSLALINYHIIPGESPLNFAQRVDQFAVFHPISFTQVAQIYCMSRYSENEISDSDKNSVYAFRIDILNMLKKELGGFKFFLNRNILSRL